MAFVKTETIGNDFVLVEAGTLPEEGLPEAAVKLCDRKFGVGSDGLLVVGHDPARDGLTLRMFNPDGSEDFCGNGLRCAAWHGHRRGWVGDAFSIRHLGRTVAARIRPDGQVTVVLPPASFLPDDVPVQAIGDPVRLEFDGLVGTAVSTGSTHFVILVEHLPGDEVFFGLSPRIETDPRFPERTSVIWTRIAAPGQLEIRIWERGAGETLGCGTGSVAAAIVAGRETGTAGRYEVLNPGGLLVAEFDSWDGPVASTTKPVVVYEGRLIERPETVASRLASLH